MYKTLFDFRLTGDDYLGTIDSSEFYQFIARYKFVIAYENGICDDYITEKLWRPLSLGVVPIYFGAPNVDVNETKEEIKANVMNRNLFFLISALFAEQQFDRSYHRF